MPHSPVRPPNAKLPHLRPPDFGEPAPLFTAETDNVPNYNFGVVGGHWVVLLFFGSLSLAASHRAHDAVLAHRALFDDRQALFFGVSVDIADRTERKLTNEAVGVRYFWDFDQAVSRLYGLTDGANLQPAIFLIDPALRIVAAEGIDQAEAVLAQLQEHLGRAADLAPPPFAPVLSLPRVFEPSFCAELIEHFGRVGGTISGFAQDVDGRTVNMVNAQLKRRSDVFITDEGLMAEIRERLERRLMPMVKRAFGWQAKHIERYLISAYTAEDSGFFSAHRDDTTAGTAHRKFAVTINLDATSYDGGDLVFLEFGRRTYRPPTGGATVFGCNLLHEVTPVTRGVRYAFLPFLYDDEGARLRKANQSRVGAPAGNRHARRSGGKRF